MFEGVIKKVAIHLFEQKLKIFLKVFSTGHMENIYYKLFMFHTFFSHK